MKPDFHQFDDIPGTTIFTIEKAHEGFHLNQFCMSLRTAENTKSSSPTSELILTSGI